jgi:2-oxoglutarate dehydrogenase E2 component (dihydrolipoamide succinyltransferase)
MAIPIRLPNLGPGDEDVRVSCWLVDLGDSVEAGDRLVEVLLPGMTFDVPAPESGVVTRIERSYDDIVAEGDILGWIEAGNVEAES